MDELPLYTFRSDAKMLFRRCAYLALAGMVLFTLTTSIGQWRAGRFPDYRRLMSAALLAPSIAAVAAAVFGLAALAYPVRILKGRLRCYDAWGCYHTVSWSDITSASVVKICGMNYFEIQARTISRPLTLPTWLANMQTFVRVVEQEAGRDSVLAVALRGALSSDAESIDN